MKLFIDKLRFYPALTRERPLQDVEELKREVGIKSEALSDKWREYNSHENTPFSSLLVKLYFMVGFPYKLGFVQRENSHCKKFRFIMDKKNQDERRVCEKQQKVKER